MYSLLDYGYELHYCSDDSDFEDGPYWNTMCSALYHFASHCVSEEMAMVSPELLRQFEIDSLNYLQNLKNLLAVKVKYRHQNHFLLNSCPKSKNDCPIFNRIIFFSL